MKLTVTGGNGYIGSHLLQEVCKGDRYDEISVVVRPESSNEHLPQDSRIKVYEYNGTAESLRPAVENSDYVIHLGAVYTTAKTDEAVESLLSANIGFSTKLFQAVNSVNPEASIVSASTFSAFDEEYRYAPKSFYAATKAAVEVIAAGFQLKVAFVRLPDTYGEGDWRTKVHNLLRDAVVRQDKQFNFQKPDYQVINLAHVEDVCRALLHTARITHEESAGVSFYDLFYPENNITLGEVATAIVANSNTAVSFPLFGEVDPLPPQNHLLPSFSMRYNPHSDLRDAIFKGLPHD